MATIESTAPHARRSESPRSTILTLTSVHERKLTQAHHEHLQTAVARYRAKAKQCWKLARVAALGGNGPLSLGYLDLAETYRAMAAGLLEQSNTLGESR